MSRYTVGKKEYFIRVVFERPEPLFFPLYLPGYDKLKEIQIIPLMCVEHHKVHGDYDDRTQPPQHDGYVFKDLNTEQIYHNQYPTASYGQLDDSQNYMVRPVGDFKTAYTDLEGHVDNIMRGLRMKQTDLKRNTEKIKQTIPTAPALSDSELEAYVSEIRNLKKYIDEIEFFNALQKHLNEIIEVMFQKHNALLVFRPHVVRYTKESGQQPDIISDWLTASVEELKETD